MESLLNCVVKKQCASLAIMHRGQFMRAYEVSPGSIDQCPTLIQHLFSAVPKLLLHTKVSEMQQFSCVPHQGAGQIEMDTDYLSDGEFLNFIAQLPQLHHLSIMDSRRQAEIPESYTPILLRALETLCAPLQLIEHLVRHPSPLPKIITICNLWPKLYGRTPPHLTVSVTNFARYCSTDGLRVCLDRIEVLELIMTPFFASDTTDVAAWITLFPNLCRVNLKLVSGRFRSAPSSARH
ncbi:hypothetical protein K438DRAFT_2000500 [Mycena galopus ATCC 62051]|nr:hypothetical protein K438DRAFT_2000500 [Mycena galopus ATCC 62051]